MDIQEATIGDLLIAFLGSARSTRAFYRILRERAFERANPKSVRTTLNRLQKQGYVENINSEWQLTGKKYVKKQKRSRIYFIPSPFKKSDPDHAIISFDIPESKRYARNWLRNQLKIFNYRMVHQSVWVGPGPLPKKFSEIAKTLEIETNIRIFKISKGSKIK